MYIYDNIITPSHSSISQIVLKKGLWQQKLMVLFLFLFNLIACIWCISFWGQSDFNWNRELNGLKMTPCNFPYLLVSSWNYNNIQVTHNNVSTKNKVSHGSKFILWWPYHICTHIIRVIYLPIYRWHVLWVAEYCVCDVVYGEMLFVFSDISCVGYFKNGCCRDGH